MDAREFKDRLKETPAERYVRAVQKLMDNPRNELESFLCANIRDLKPYTREWQIKSAADHGLRMGFSSEECYLDILNRVQFVVEQTKANDEGISYSYTDLCGRIKRVTADDPRWMHLTKTRCKQESAP